MSEDASPRHVPPGSCSWCGHPPHDTPCAATVRLSKDVTAECPCRRTMTPTTPPEGTP